MLCIVHHCRAWLPSSASLPSCLWTCRFLGRQLSPSCGVQCEHRWGSDGRNCAETQFSYLVSSSLFWEEVEVAWVSKCLSPFTSPALFLQTSIPLSLSLFSSPPPSFLAMLVSWLCGWQCRSSSWSGHFCLETSTLLDGLSEDFVQTRVATVWDFTVLHD